MRAAIFIGILLLLPSRAFGCLGEDFEWTRAALSPNPTLSRIATFLKTVSGCGHSSEQLPQTADRDVLTVLRRAAHLGVDRELVAKAFKTHRCAYSARDDPGYNDLLDFLGLDSPSELCDTKAFAALAYVLPESGAVVREGPSLAHPRLGALARGVIVRRESLVGDWHKISYGRAIGYMHASVLRNY